MWCVVKGVYGASISRGGATALRLRAIEFALECSFMHKQCFDVHGL